MLLDDVRDSQEARAPNGADVTDPGSRHEILEDSSSDDGMDDGELIRMANVHKTYLLGLEGV